jgi:hypothetical protein
LGNFFITLIKQLTLGQKVAHSGHPVFKLGSLPLVTIRKQVYEIAKKPDAYFHSAVNGASYITIAKFCKTNSFTEINAEICPLLTFFQPEFFSCRNSHRQFKVEFAFLVVRGACQQRLQLSF